MASVSTSVVYSYLSRNYPPRVLGWVKKADWRKTTVALSSINMARRPGGREPDKVDAISKAVSNGKSMEPVVLVRTDSGYDIADGYHRTLAFDKAGKKSISAYVGSGAGEHGLWEKSMHAAKLNTGVTMKYRDAMKARMAKAEDEGKADEADKGEAAEGDEPKKLGGKALAALSAKAKTMKGPDGKMSPKAMALMAKVKAAKGG